MAVRPINLYNSYDSTSNGTIYYNSGTNLFYSDADCQTQITRVAVPRRSQYTFTGYYSSISGGTMRVDANGNIISWSAGTSTSELKIYSRWTIFSQRFYINENGTSIIGWILRDTEMFRAIAGGDIYKDDQLTNGPITSIQPPYAPQYAFRGCWYENDSSVVQYSYIDKDGNILSDMRTRASTSSYNLGITPKWYKCYKATLDANGGTGGEVSPIWYDSVQGRWCSDEYLQNIITTVTKPTSTGKIFKGYYTASSGGTQVVGSEGNIKASWTSVTSANTTVYAQWNDPVTITVNHGGGSGVVNTLYYGAGNFFDNNSLTTPVTSVAVPTLTNHRFLGYYSGSTQVIDASGNISGSWAPSSAVTITAQWERVSYTINVQANGGGGVSAIYANAARTAVYADEMCSGSPLTSITPLTRAGYRFMGLYATNAVSGTQLVDASGNFTASFSSFLSGITGTVTVYALWQQVFTIQLDADGGSGAPGEIYFDDAYGQFYDDPDMTTPVSSIAVPTKECYQFGGFYSASSGGTQRISAAGTIVSGWTPTENCTIYAWWTRRSYKYTLDPNGGTTAQAAIYNNGSSSTYYADDALTTVATTVALPTRPGYTFGGYKNGSTNVVSAAGAVVVGSPITADTTATAQWTANTYTLTFDYNGGTGSTVSKQVTFGQPVGQLPTATRSRASFAGWVIDGDAATSSTVYDVPSDTTAQAQWNLRFGGVTDWFRLASSSLKPISSNSGDNRQRLCVMHTGKYESGVGETSGVWRNPTVTYQVVRNCNLQVTLGAAFSGNGTSGYMITGVKVETKIGQFPTVTVSATANEGANAINTFQLAVSLLGRARAQNLLGAVQGGGQIQSCSLQASCTPVVIAENNMPCASDIVGGKLTVTASTYAPNTEAAPTAGGSFTEVGVPKQCGDKDYLMWQFKAERDM